MLVRRNPKFGLAPFIPHLRPLLSHLAHHGVIAITMDIIFADIKRFVETYQGEIVVIHFGDFSNMHNGSELNRWIQTVNETLGNLIQPSNQRLQDLTYSKMTETGKRIVAVLTGPRVRLEAQNRFS
jgi:hypothetical protein